MGAIKTIKARPFEWGNSEKLSEFIANHVGESTSPFFAEPPENFKAWLRMNGRDPTKDLILAFLPDNALGGFAFVESEAKIGRSIIDIEYAAVPEKKEVVDAVLDASLKRAYEQGNPLVHIGVLSGTKPDLREKTTKIGFYHVRSYWQMSRSEGGEVPAKEDWTYISLRTMVGVEEVPELTALQNMAFYSRFGFAPNTVEENRAKLLASGKTQRVLFAEDKKGRLLGYCWLSAKNAERNGKKQGRIEMLGVRLNAREKGMGKYLMAGGLRELSELGAKEISLDVDATNGSAIHLYKKLGFRKTGSIDWLELPVR